MWFQQLMVIWAVVVGGVAWAGKVCEGEWKTAPTSDTGLYHFDETRVPFNASEPSLSASNFLRTACPAQRSAYSCHFTGDEADGVRARELERRVYHPKPESSCFPFAPAAFMKLIEGRKVLMVGDSITGQIWQSLVCSLYRLDETYFDVDFWIEPDCSDPRKCPARPNPEHGHVVTAYLAMRSTQSQLIFHFHSLYRKPNDLKKLVEKYQLSSQDFVIMNYGLFYNNRTSYEPMLHSLSNGIEMVLRAANSPYVMFRQTTPQHFDTENGYDDPLRDRTKYACKGGSSPKDDWRNVLADAAIRPLEGVHRKKFYFLHVAQALYSQYDAHIFNGDCTHWCSTSGVFRYLQMMLFNGMYDLLSRKGDDADARAKAAADIAFSLLDHDDDTWKLHPTLRNGQNVQIESDARTIYLVEKGRLRPYPSVQFFSQQGNLWNSVRRVPERVGRYAVRGTPIPATNNP